MITFLKLKHSCETQFNKNIEKSTLSQVLGYPSTPFRYYKSLFRDGRVAQGHCLEHLPSKCEAPSSNPSTAKTNDHKLTGLKQHRFITLQFWRSEVQNRSP
jgi:hypothetical protein